MKDTCYVNSNWNRKGSLILTQTPPISNSLLKKLAKGTGDCGVNRLALLLAAFVKPWSRLCYLIQTLQDTPLPTSGKKTEIRKKDGLGADPFTLQDGPEAEVILFYAWHVRFQGTICNGVTDRNITWSVELNFHQVFVLLHLDMSHWRFRLSKPKLECRDNC